MFERKTVFVLGAGASWHYGYPTGEGLVQDVLTCTRLFKEYCENRLSAKFNLGQMPKIVSLSPNSRPAPRDKWSAALHLASEFENRLESVSPLVIDYFLGWNQPFHEIGRTMIAGALLRRESHGAGRKNYNRWLSRTRDDEALRSANFPYHRYQDNWVRFITHQLLLGCKKSKDILQNNVVFITFNYDLSLERTLREALEKIDFLEPAHINDFLDSGLVIHMYGALQPTASHAAKDYESLSDPNFDYERTVEKIVKSNELLDSWFDAARDLAVIDPHTKHNTDVTTISKTNLQSAERIYFLGFGFDKNNLNRLGFPLAITPYNRNAEIYFTNLGNSLSINKRVANTFDAHQLFTADSWRVPAQHYTIERSIRTTYEAIALDFATFDD